MEEQKLRRLMDSLSNEEKILQLLQLTGRFFGETAEQLTGPAAKMGLSQNQAAMTGSVLSCVGAERTMAVQRACMQQHPIPLLFMADVINGYRTIFPIPLAQGCSFDPELVNQAAAAAAREAAWAGIHCVFSPMVDLVRDARWGRCMESTGEDVFLNCRMAEAMVAGYQGNGMKDPESVAACVKHFAAYGAPTGGREYTGAELSEHTLRQDYLPAYEAAVKSGCAMVMTAFNSVNGIPCTANRWLLRKILREEMGFDGVVISDWGAVAELVTLGVAEEEAEAAGLALEAGVDVEMMSGCYLRHLPRLLERGAVRQEQLDAAVWRVLCLKNRLGLFENPFRGADPEKDGAPAPDAHRELARKLVRESLVLLENRDNILPLTKASGKIALIGPYADNRELNGSWSIFANTEDNLTLHQALAEAGIWHRCCQGSPRITPGEEFPGRVKIQYSSVAAAQAQQLLEEAVSAAREADTVILALGEHPEQSGEAASRVSLNLPDVQIALLEAVAKVNPNIVTLIFTGRPLVLERVRQLSKAILITWLPGTEGGHGICDVLLGQEAPSGKLSMSFPRSVGQEPLWYSDLRSGRPKPSFPSGRYYSGYLDSPASPLYPFGFGLSYTTFAYGVPRLSGRTLSPGETLRICVDVENTGTVTATETAQLYLCDLAASVVRPERELKGFQRILLAPGSKQEVVFTLTESDLAFAGPDGAWRAEPGRFALWIGGSSLTENRAEFTLNGQEEKDGAGCNIN